MYTARKKERTERRMNAFRGRKYEDEAEIKG
jgi:hypothetical protein